MDKHSIEDDKKPIEKKKSNVDTRIIRMIDLHLKSYYTAIINGQIASKDGKVLLFEKTVKIEQKSGLWLRPAEMIAEEQGGEPIRADKALQVLWHKDKNIAKLKAMVLGKIHKRRF
jgi:hypothetical protein